MPRNGSVESAFTMSIERLRRGIQSGELDPVELTARYLERISHLDPQIRAFVDVDPKRALAEASRITPQDTRPLAGIPMAIKANRDAVGLVSDHGARALHHHRAGVDSSIVARLRRAGAVIVGTTTCSEFSLLPSCEPLLHGPVVNPTDATRGTGGSSGGSAAAVAAGLIPIAHANDAAGSLRIPAISCGLVGLMRFTGGHPIASWVAEGFIARTVDDAVCAASALEPELIEPVARTRAPGVIAVARRTPGGGSAPPDAESRLDEAVDRLHAAGWQVDEVAPPWSGEIVNHLFAAMAPAARDRALAAMRSAGVDPSTAETEPYTHEFLEHASRVRNVDHARARHMLTEWSAEIDEWSASYDAVLTPLVRAPEPGVLSGTHGIRELSPHIGTLTGFAWPANAMHWSAICLEDVQFIGPGNRLPAMISAARAVERPAQPENAS